MRRLVLIVGPLELENVISFFLLNLKPTKSYNLKQLEL